MHHASVARFILIMQMVDGLHQVDRERVIQQHSAHYEDHLGKEAYTTVEATHITSEVKQVVDLP